MAVLRLIRTVLADTDARIRGKILVLSDSLCVLDCFKVALENRAIEYVEINNDHDMKHTSNCFVSQYQRVASLQGMTRCGLSVRVRRSRLLMFGWQPDRYLFS